VFFSTLFLSLKDFYTYISEPFLTSEEQDKLINQLRDAKFFEAFHYDNQTANWICESCAPPVGKFALL
jgi:hypothetical protein